jgi:hypothetical protein
MLNNLSEQIRKCLEHAEDCAHKAAAQTDQKLKQDFLDLERRWLVLVQSYEFTQRLGDFSDEAQRKADNLQSDSPPRRTDHTALAGSGVRSRNRSSYSKCFSYDVRGAWVEQPGRRHDPTSCRKDHRIGERRIKKSDRVAFGCDQEF